MTDEPLINNLFFHQQVKGEVEKILAASRADLIASRNLEYPNEAVGIVCADGDVYPLINQARSNRRFEVGETLVGEAINHLKYRDKHPVAVYHSHPESDSGPSKRDQMLMQEMPKAINIIVGMDGIAAWLWDGELRFVAKIPLEAPNVEHT